MPTDGKNGFGRPIFQGLQYSGTPTQPLVEMEFVDKSADQGVDHGYSIITVNTVDLKQYDTASEGGSDMEDDACEGCSRSDTEGAASTTEGGGS